MSKFLHNDDVGAMTTPWCFSITSTLERGHFETTTMSFIAIYVVHLKHKFSISILVQFFSSWQDLKGQTATKIKGLFSSTSPSASKIIKYFSKFNINLIGCFCCCTKFWPIGCQRFEFVLKNLFIKLFLFFAW